MIPADNRSKRRRNEKMTKQDFTIFAERRENQHIHISPQLTLATFQYLSTGEWHQVRMGLAVFLSHSCQIFKCYLKEKAAISNFHSHCAPFICHSVLSHCCNVADSGVWCDHYNHPFVFSLIVPIRCCKPSFPISLNDILHGTTKGYITLRLLFKLNYILIILN